MWFHDVRGGVADLTALFHAELDQHEDVLHKLSGPINPEMERAAVQASLADVDHVVIFSEDTPLRVMEAIRPDVLVKSNDYSRETVIGADVVESYGGRVILAEFAPESSTTGTVGRILRQHQVFGRS